MKTLAVVLAGGIGSRFHGEKPKQLMMLGKKPVLCHSVDVLATSPEIDEVLVISHIDYVPTIQQLLDGQPIAVLAGGDTRSASSDVALAYANEHGFDRILLHDAARPLIDSDLVSRLCAALNQADAAIAALPATDTISVSVDGETIDHTPPRETLWSIQTPQAFSVSVLTKAYALFDADPAAVATDDGGVVRRYLPEIPVKLVLGSRRAMKLTYPEDLAILETLI